MWTDGAVVDSRWSGDRNAMCDGVLAAMAHALGWVMWPVSACNSCKLARAHAFSLMHASQNRTPPGFCDTVMLVVRPFELSHSDP